MIRMCKMGLNRILRIILLNRHRSLWAIASLSILSLLLVIYPSRLSFARTGNSSRPHAHPPSVTFVCERGDAVRFSHVDDDPLEETISVRTRFEKFSTEPKILLMVETQFTQFGHQLCAVFDSMKISYKAQMLEKNLPPLVNSRRGVYAVVIFENFYKYLNLDRSNRKILDDYCRRFNASIVAFMPSRPDYKFSRARVKGFPLHIRQNLRVHSPKLDATAVPSFFHLTRPGGIDNETFDVSNQKSNWVGFESQHETYRSILNVQIKSNFNGSRSTLSASACLLDSGQFDGIRRLFFGNDFTSFWLLKLLFIDGLQYLTRGLLSLPLIRHLQIDVDDIFVGDTDKKMTSQDVEEFLAAQNRLRLLVTNFTFNLGFSGKFFGRGGWIEQQGDLKLIEYAQRFWWFSHSWGHCQAHNKNFTDLTEDMLRNLLFAKEHGISVDWPYSVAPHHSGVYPVHEPLYEAWRSVWNVTTTSTEQYPHLRPAGKRRGFVHNGVKVLPRQTCGLYTHTTLLEKYAGGKKRLDQSIQGGELFYTLVLNQNPCADKKHRAIWPPDKSCDQLPKAIIIGPQKTGTTALYKFLKLHAQVRSNIDSNKTFEEVQFFSGRFYKNGIDWYMSHFELNDDKTSAYFFEKSATYFASDLAPQRVHALIPGAKLICIITNPATRAYSWYQHMKFRKDPAASENDFLSVLKTRDDGNKKILALRNRCLYPGRYAEHIERWLNYFPAKQLLVVDGEILKTRPSSVMDLVQNFLEIQPKINFTGLLKFSDKKGFYCALDRKNNKTSCLGQSKGRRYDPMTPENDQWLSDHFRPHNVALFKLLTRTGHSIPRWLYSELKRKT